MLFLLLELTNSSLAATNTYRVKKGDTLYSIARSYKISVHSLKQTNHLTSDRINLKQVLKVPQVKPTVMAIKKPQVMKVITVTATAYTANCRGCSGITAIGTNLKKNPNQKVISVDPKLIKLGTKVYVEGYGYAIAADKGSAIKGNKIDVFIPTQKAALKWGRKTVKVKILK